MAWVLERPIFLDMEGPQMKQVFLPLAARGLLATPGGFLADVAQSTYAYGISGRNIVGIYTIAGIGGRAFCYDGTSYRTLSHPGASSTSASGIDGSNIVGFYIEPTKDRGEGTHGFLYNGSSFTTLDNPQLPAGQTTGTFPNGIEGRNIVGYCRDLTPHSYSGSCTTGTPSRSCNTRRPPKVHLRMA